MPLFYYSIDIVLQEVPGEVSICFNICGCDLRCKGCHAPFLWTEKNGSILSEEIFTNTLEKYQGLASCVLFMGGEWATTELIQFIKQAKHYDYKTCLYTGREQVPKEISEHLTWLKTGAWISELGGLSSPKTNQKFIEVCSNKVLNKLFITS